MTCRAVGDSDEAGLAEACRTGPRTGRDFDERLADDRGRWRGFLATSRWRRPIEALDAMVNTWLPYQALACRIRARSAFYQASGAFGFRDQLQDTLALPAA